MLVVALTWLLYKPVLKMVKEREHIIAKGVEDAEKASIRLSHADTEVKARLSKADVEAGGIVEHARQTATSERVRILREAEELSVRVAADAEAHARELAARTLRESEKEIARLAILGAEKILKRHYD